MSFPPSLSSLYNFISLLAPLEIHCLLFINCCLMHMCMSIYIPKYNLLSMYKVTRMYGLRAGRLVLGNLFMSFPGEDFHLLSVLLSEITWAVPVSYGTPTDVVFGQLMFKQSCC